MDENGAVVSEPKSKAPVVTYISRQSGVRRLSDEAHEGLVKELQALEAEGLIELNIAAMEFLTFSEQLETVARTTVSDPTNTFPRPLNLHLRKDHGWCTWEWLNGNYSHFRQNVNQVTKPLQHQLWMPSSPRSTIIEIFYPLCTFEGCFLRSTSSLLLPSLPARLRAARKKYGSQSALPFFLYRIRLNLAIALRCVERHIRDVCPR